MSNPALKGDEIARNPNGYLALATRAAELEREGRYIAALDLWKAAWKVAKNGLNQEWAKGRVNLCSTCIHRFGKREA
ncbi:ANR family transcriptional regulator [Aeromonas taiwanensis]|uniref:ANR family transcriptional regulator n=1 Tax=Aeromonas TaxID=642 RepID=UPI0022E1708A|nr:MULTISPECIES: ANR family transcriptional regulator [Aeromonas]WEE23643.1 ANR family transcriptional regulator [Aeromonas caviae]